MEPILLLGISLGFNSLIGIAMYFMKMDNDNTKEHIRDLKQEQDKLRDTAFRREDFHDFRNQLWSRLDKMEADVKAQLTDLKKV